MAGYNSLCEVVSLRKKALVVPRLGPRAEQRMRAELFQEKGLIDVLDPQEVSPKNLAQRISEDLERTDFPLVDAAIDMSGGRNAAWRLSGLIEERAGVLPMSSVSASPVAGASGAKGAAAR
jgi:predicted glycosyltransferase